MNRHLISDANGLHTTGEQPKYIHLSSTNRDHALYEDPSFCRLELRDEFKQVSEIELVQFEIANPRNTIESNINQQFVFSEYDAVNDRYNTYRCELPTGTYPLHTLLSVLQGAMNCPIPITTTANPYNRYNCQSDGIGGRIRVESFSTLPENTQWNFQLHFGVGTYIAIASIDIANDQITFKRGETPFEVWRPGHVLRFAPRRFRQLEVQVYSWIDQWTVQLRAGDLSVPLAATTFADIQPITVESKYHTNTALTRLLGFEEVDLQGGSFVQVLAISNPTAFPRDNTSEDVTVVVETRSDVGPVTNKLYTVSNSGTFLDTIPYLTVDHTESSAHFIAFKVSLTSMWATGLTVDDGTTTTPTSLIAYNGTSTFSVMNLVIDFPPGHGLNNLLPSLLLSGFVGYSGPPVEAQVVAWNSVDQVEVGLVFPFTPSLPNPFVAGAAPGAVIQHVNNVLTPIQYVSPRNFDLTASRRVCLVALNVGDKLIGNIQTISKEQYFARIQLDSGPLQVQFSAGSNILGHYIEPNPIKVITAITLRFVTEDGYPFPFIGVDWTLLLKVKCEKL